MCKPIAFRQYALITENSDLTADDLKNYPLMQTDYAQDNEILWETYPIVCHKKLEPTDIDFGFSIDTTNGYIVWGLTVHKFEEKAKDMIDQYQFWRECKPEGVSRFSFHCSVSINIYSADLVPGLIATDATYKYYNIPKQMVIEHYGLDPDSPEEDFAKRFGGITSEQYISYISNT